MLTLLCHIATGTPFDGRAVRQGGCLYVSLEDPGELVAYRVHLIAQAYQLDLEEIASNLKVLDGSQVDGSLAAERQVSGRKLLSMTDRWTEICGMAKGCVAIAIDNSSDAYDADEVVRRLVRAFMRNLRELALSERAAVILLAHVDKVAARYGASGNSYSGSTAWHNSARSRLAMGLVDDGTVVVTHEKNNLGPLADPLSLVWVEGVLMPVAADAAQMVLDATKRRDLDAAVALIETAVAAGYAVPANTTGPNTTCTVLSQMPGFSDVFTSDAAGRKRLNQSIAALRASGEVLVQEYTNDNRKTARRLALSEKRLLEMEAGSESKTFRVDIDR